MLHPGIEAGTPSQAKSPAPPGQPIWLALRWFKKWKKNYQAKKNIKDNHDILISVHVCHRWIYLPTCIWFTFPAVMFEMVQQASFLMLFLWLCVNRFRRQGRAWWFIIHCKRWKKRGKESIKYLLRRQGMANIILKHTQGSMNTFKWLQK